MVIADPRTLRVHDLFAPDVVVDPFPLYRELRPRTPFRTADGHWVVMRHNDVFSALSNHRVFSSNLSHIDNEVLRETPIIFEDPPGHTRHRKLVQPAFTARRMTEMVPWVTAVVDEAVGALPVGEIDIIGALCDPLPVRVVARVMGVPDERGIDFKRWSDERTYLVAQRGTPTSPEQASRVTEARAANRLMLDYFLEEARGRRAQAMADLISDLVHANDGDDALSEEEVAAVCALLLTAGNVTTTNVLGNVLGLLADNPEVFEAVRDNRSLIDEVVEEALRLEAPVQWLYRRTLRDTELGGAEIPAGESVIVYFGAANRDPDAYPEPERFDLANRARRHAAFGHGIHFCLGAPLARLETALVLQAILERFSSITRGTGPTRRISDAATHCGYVELSLVLR